MNNIWEELIEYARWSPSPHNVQPWRIKIISDEEADIYYQPQRLLPVEDYTGCFTILGFGIFIENMSIAASKQGFKVVEDYRGTLLDANDTIPIFFTKLKLIPTKESLVLDRELIKSRRTSRLPYNNKKIDQEKLNSLNEIAKDYGYKFDFSTDSDIVKWVLQLNCDTLFSDMTDTLTRKEVGNWIRYTKKQALEKNDGLWAYCMNTPSLLLYLAFNIPWLFNLPLVSSILKNQYLKTTQGTTTIGWLSGPFKTPSEWIKAGHMIARLWIQMTKYEIYLHPFGSIITNSASHKKFKEKFKVDENTNPVWLLVRLGYSQIPPRSRRLEVNDILIK